MTFYAETTLPSGLRVITESIPHVRSASVGVWVGAGSCLETPTNTGISHFIEHMLFKGTTSRTAKQIAQAIDGRGGSLNAFTAKEQTCFYAKVLDEHLPVAVEVLADMIQHSRFDPTDIEKEKGVICEEIRMYEDEPDDLVHDLFAAAMWRGHALGQPIAGSVESVQSYTRDEILEYYAGHYTPDQIVVAAAGNLSHEQVVAEVAKQFQDLNPARTGGRELPASPAEVAGSRALFRVKKTEQAHLVLGVKGLQHNHADLYALHLLNTVLGGGTSSRLFQEIREERGLAYSVYSYESSFRNTGNFAVYAGISPRVVGQVLELILGSIQEIGKQGITESELAEAKEQLKGQIMLGLESTSGRMSRLGRGELMLGRVIGPDQILARIEAVTCEQVHALAHKLLLQEPQVLSLVGPSAAGVDLHQFGFEEVLHE